MTTTTTTTKTTAMVASSAASVGRIGDLMRRVAADPDGGGFDLAITSMRDTLSGFPHPALPEILQAQERWRGGGQAVSERQAVLHALAQQIAQAAGSVIQGAEHVVVALTTPEPTRVTE